MSTIEIYNELHKIQKSLVAPKTQHNKFGNYSYRSCEDILEALKKVMPEGGSVCLTDEIKQIGDRIYVEARASFNFKGASIITTAYAREPQEKKGSDPSQITGSASSYARKYALNGLFCIDDSKDADHTNEHDNSSRAQQRGPSESNPIPKLQKAISLNNRSEAMKIWSSLKNEDKAALWHMLSESEQGWLKENRESK